MFQNKRFIKLLKLFLVFFRIGAFTFGGGYAMIPFIQREIVEKNKWIKEDEVIDIFAIVQSVPGVIAINSSIFVGYRVAGLPGAVASTLGMVLPSFIIISFIATFLYKFREIKIVDSAFQGIRAGVVALIVFAVQKLGKPSIKDLNGWIIAISTFVVSVATEVNVVYILLVAALLGLVLKYPHKRKEE